MMRGWNGDLEECAVGIRGLRRIGGVRRGCPSRRSWWPIAGKGELGVGLEWRGAVSEMDRG